MAEPFLPSVLSCAMALFALCEHGLVPVLVMGSVGSPWACVCQNCGHTELQSTLPVLSPEKLLLVGGACSQSSPLLGLQSN